MGFFDGFVKAVKKAVKKVKKAIDKVVDTAAKTVEDTVNAIDEGVDTLGQAAQAGLDGARGWVDDNLGNSVVGHVARAGIDVVKIGIGLTELAFNVAAAGVVLVSDIAADILTGRFSQIPQDFDKFIQRVEKERDEFLDDISTYAIHESVIGRDIPGIYKKNAKAWSVAAVLKRNRTGTPDPRTYRSTGKRYEFKLIDGAVWYREVTMTCDEPQWKLLTEKGHGDSGVMASFDFSRAGSRFPAPEFESITANADRVFVKEKGKDNFYFLLMDELFWGPPDLDPKQDPDNVENIIMPSNYIKLDPEKHRPGAKREDLLAALAEPLPMIPQSERHPVFREVLTMGITWMMVVKVKPRVWYRLDNRPPLDSGRPPLFQGLVPQSIPTYKHITYQSQTFPIGSLIKKSEPSIDYDMTLDIGVGNSHFHEQWSAIYGGEMKNTRLEYFQNLNIGEINYSVLNGPLSDSDHFADGTCNFYLLVRLRGHNDNIVVLYCDEQTFFTQRWRLVDPYDNQPVEFEKMNFSLAAALGRDDRRMHGFHNEHFWTPFGNAYLNTRSRMTVSRTVIIVSGRDHITGNHELYSINYGYGLSDRTWRWRNLSNDQFNAQYLSESDVESGNTDSVLKVLNSATVFPQTLHLREDMSITLQGTAITSGGILVTGVWSQKYLPASCEHIPSKEHMLEQTHPNHFRQKPEKGFTHPWTFWSDKAFKYADRFSHLGVYADIDDRIQYYEVDILEDGSSFPESFECTFKDRSDEEGDSVRDVEMGQLYIKARKIKWKTLGDYLRTLQSGFVFSLVEVLVKVAKDAKNLFFNWEVVPKNQTTAENQLRASRRSMYNQHGLFVLHNRGPLGWIAVWKDKRDDDLISLSDLPMQVVLKRNNSDKEIRVRFKKNHRVHLPPVVQEASVTLKRFIGNNAIHIWFKTDRSDHDLNVNIWRFHLAALDCSQKNMVVSLLEGIRYRDLKPVEGKPGEWEGDFPIHQEELPKYNKYLGEQGRLEFGTSLWFENVVGQAACAEKLNMLVHEWNLPSSVNEDVQIDIPLQHVEGTQNPATSPIRKR